MSFYSVERHQLLDYHLHLRTKFTACWSLMTPIILSLSALGTQCPRKGCRAAVGIPDSGQPDPGPHRSGEQAARTWRQVCNPKFDSPLLLYYYALCDQVEMVSFWLLCRSKGMRKYNAIDKWNSQLKSIYQTVSNRVGWDGYWPSRDLHLWDMLIACFGDLRANAYCFMTLEVECWIWVTRNADVM